MRLQFVEADTGHSPFSSIGRALEDKLLDIIAAVKQQQERTWHPRMVADIQLPERFGEPYAAVICLQKQGAVEQIRLSGLQVGGTHLLPESNLLQDQPASMGAWSRSSWQVCIWAAMLPEGANSTASESWVPLA